MTLPTPEEILKGLDLDPLPAREDVERAIEKGVRAAEVLLQVAIFVRECREEVLLGGAVLPVLLAQFPVHEVKIDDTPPGRGWWAEEGIGFLGTEELAPSSYSVYFRVGCRGYVPAIYREIIGILVRRRLGAPEGTEHLPALAVAGRRVLDRERQERVRLREGGR